MRFRVSDSPKDRITGVSGAVRQMGVDVERAASPVETLLVSVMHGRRSSMIRRSRCQQGMHVGMGGRARLFVAVLVLLGLFLTACGGGAATTPTAAPPAAAKPTEAAK